jgi:hypothetical protein
MLKKGDVITHSFRGGDGGILDDRGRMVLEVRTAVNRGMHLDIGHGAGSPAFDTAEKTMKQELLPKRRFHNVGQLGDSVLATDLVLHDEFAVASRSARSTPGVDTRGLYAIQSSRTALDERNAFRRRFSRMDIARDQTTARARARSASRTEMSLRRSASSAAAFRMRH